MPKNFLMAGLSFCLLQSLPAAIIGTNPPSRPLTLERIAKLPDEQQAPWRGYLERSARQMQADKAFFEAEMKAHGITKPIVPPSSHAANSIPLEKPDAWYASAEARGIADIIVSFQTPAGGWSKNINMTRHRRAPGERFALAGGPHVPSASDNDLPREAEWSYIGTIDNDATMTQLRFLAKTIHAAGKDTDAASRTSFMRGLDYLFAAQYPNGGWPQVWPLEGGYHDAITYNDDAILNVLELLRDVADGQGEFAFVPAEKRALAASSVKRGIQCIVASQIMVAGRRTVWCQQHDPLTLEPASARNYEMPSECSAESASIMMFLMKLPNPGPDVTAAVHGAAAWFNKTKLEGIAFKSTGPAGRQLISAPGEGPLWSRYYEIGTDRPIFGDRDKTIHDNVNEISRERRQGYGWYRDTPKRALEHYAHWAKGMK